MKKLCFLLLTLPLLLCACERNGSGVYYNGLELSESEIQELMYRETQAETDVTEVSLVAFDKDMSAPKETSVFWTKNGSVFHWQASCQHLTNKKEVYYGTVEDAVSCEKLRACLVCEKE